MVRWGLRMVLVGERILTRRLMLLLGRISKVNKLQWMTAKVRYVPRINRTSPGITTGSEEAMSMMKLRTQDVIVMYCRVGMMLDCIELMGREVKPGYMEYDVSLKWDKVIVNQSIADIGTYTQPIQYLVNMHMICTYSRTLPRDRLDTYVA